MTHVHIAAQWAGVPTPVPCTCPATSLGTQCTEIRSAEESATACGTHRWWVAIGRHFASPLCLENSAAPSGFLSEGVPQCPKSSKSISVSRTTDGQRGPICFTPLHQPQPPMGMPPFLLHALLDPGAGDLVVVWGPGGQRDTVNRLEKGGSRSGPRRWMGTHPPSYTISSEALPVPHPPCVPAGSQSRKQRGSGWESPPAGFVGQVSCIGL